MNVKYQIFISSTYDDLRIEREQVIRAALEMGHIPVGMEMFSAADDEQWKIITRQIDDSDYYVVIAAHRYGSVVDGVSYTEKEYDYAVQRGVPVIGFLIEPSAPWPADRMEPDQGKRVALEAFKEKLRKKPVGTWSAASELYGKFSIAFMKLTTANPRPGWVRATGIAGPEVIAELTRLSSENARLRGELEQSKAAQTEDSTTAQSRDALQKLSRVKVKPCVWFRDASDWTFTDETTLLDIFVLLAPQLATEYSASAAASHLAYQFGGGKATRAKWPLPFNLLNLWLTDIMALGLVEPSGRKHAVGDAESYWTLTKAGRDAHGWLRKLEIEQKSTVIAEPSPNNSTESKTAPPETGTKPAKDGRRSKRRAG